MLAHSHGLLQMIFDFNKSANESKYGHMNTIFLTENKWILKTFQNFYLKDYRITSLEKAMVFNSLFVSLVSLEKYV